MASSWLKDKNEKYEKWLAERADKKAACKQFKIAKEAHEEKESKYEYATPDMKRRMTGNSFRSACAAASKCDSKEATDFVSTNGCSSTNGGRKKKRKSRRRKTKNRRKTKRKSRRRKSRKTKRRRRRRRKSRR